MIDWVFGFIVGAAVAWGWTYIHWDSKYFDLHLKHQSLRASFKLITGKDPDKWTL